MTTDANLLLVSNGIVPERIRAELEGQGALVEAVSTNELAVLFQVLGPDLVVHFGLDGAHETVRFLRKERESRIVRLVLVGPRTELAQLRKLDREVVLGVLAEDMPEHVICERLLSLSSRKQEPHRAIPVPSAKTPSVPPDVLDPHLQRPLLPPPPLPPPGFERPSFSAAVSSPPPSEEKILTWLRSTPPPRISEKEPWDELPGEAGDELAGAAASRDPEALPCFEEEKEEGDFELTLTRSEETAQPGALLLPDSASTSGDAALEEPLDDRDTLMMEIDPRLIESEDTVADRETTQMGIEPPVDPPESSVSSLVTDTRIEAVAQAQDRVGPKVRPWVRWGLVALAPISLIFVLIQRRASIPEEERQPDVLAAKGAGLESAPIPSPPPALEGKVPAASTEFDLWVRPENPDVPACDRLLGDKEGLRVGDVDQSALIWKRARGRLVLGDRVGAHTELCRAAYIFPAGLAVEALIEQLLDMDAPRMAEPFMEQAIKARPHRPKTLELQGDLASQLGDQKKARETWILALGVTEATPKVLAQIARQIVGQAETVLSGGQAGLAERLFRRAALIDKTNASALRGLAKIAESRGDTARADAFRALAEEARRDLQ